MKKKLDNNKIVNKVSIVTVSINIILFIIKFLAGIFGKSFAMISDSIHSLSDVFTTVIAFIGSKIASKKPDKNHPYGHEKVESLASILLAIILFIIGINIGYSGFIKIITGDYKNLIIPTNIALISAILSIIIKELMYWYTRYYAIIIASDLFMADAWHHRSDAISSIGSFIGIGLSMIGFPIFDPLVSILICFLILKIAIEIMLDSIKKLLDTSCSDEYEKKLICYIKNQEGVIDIDLIKTRMFGNMVYVDVEISVDNKLSLKEAHDICHNVHDNIEKNFLNIKHVMIHVNPSDNN